MTDQEIRQIIQKTLGPFMRQFDMDNRGNRLSMELIAGLGGRLEDLIVEIILKQDKQVTNFTE
jgi:hypothetical protein